jgi:hypothetical protein
MQHKILLQGVWKAKCRNSIPPQLKLTLILAKSRINSFKTVHVLLIKQKITITVMRERFTWEQAYSGKEILHVNVLHCSRKNKITFFTSKIVFFIESFCTELERIWGKNLKKIGGRGLLSGRAGTLNK